MASPRYSWQANGRYDTVRNVTFIEHSPSSLSSDYTEVTAVGYFLYVPNPSMSCSTDAQCSDSYNNLPVECISGKCQCSNNTCWIYTYEKNGMFADIVYSCGKCGQLGSQCYGTITCDKPGICGADHFCHCRVGEHKDDVCFASSENYVVQFLLACVFIILFFTATALAYQTFWSIRHHGRICWCRRPNFSRRSRRRRGRSSRQIPRGVEKTPAYTAQQRIYQNFHQRNDSETESDEEYTDEENINEEKNADNGSTSTLINMDTVRKMDERNLQLEEIELKTFPIKTTKLEDEKPSISSETEDVTGMTDYYNEYSSQL